MSPLGTSSRAAVPVVGALVVASLVLGGHPAGASSDGDRAGAAGTLAAAAADMTADQTSQPRHPSPTHFTHGHVDNRWFPLKPGTRSVYRGVEEGDRSRDIVLVTYRTHRVDGVTCRAVHDRLFLDGILRERTTDWYAQTRRGTVWYFGERTAELDRHGHVVSREGSWQSGRDGAEAGIFMPVHPRIGQSFRQEDYPGHAEDRFRIIGLPRHVVTPLLSSHHALLTKETSVLEPDVVDHKFYVREIGFVREATVRGGRETGAIVSMQHVPRHP
jgi:hypothetical protein